MNNIDRRHVLALGLAAPLSGPAWAQEDWPSKPVRLILSHAAGSGTDAIARLVSERLTKVWGQAVVVENKPGGQNSVGATAAARSAPDGQTFFFSTLAALVTNTYLFKSLTYDPRKDFTSVGLLGRSAFVLAVVPTSPLKSMKDYLAAAKQRPGQVSVATEGPKTFSGMLLRVLGARTGTEVNLISYVSASAGVNDTLGGQTEAVLCDLPSAVPMIKAGRLRPLGVSSASRIKGMEEVPPIAETVPGYDYTGWLAFMAPTGTPAGPVRRFARDLNTVLDDPDLVARIEALGPKVEKTPRPEAMDAFFKAEHARWESLTKEIGVLPE